jgi:aspartate aminotransferase
MTWIVKQGFYDFKNYNNMPKVSSRSLQVPLSPFRKLAGLAEKAKARGIKVYHLNIGQPDIPTMPDGLSVLRGLSEAIIPYGPAEGWPSTRASMATYYEKWGVKISPDEVMITSGASEALQMVFFACFGSGDEVIIPEPFYANYNGFAHTAGVKVRPVACYIEEGFALPGPEAFEAEVTPATRGILLCNPNNPTGACYSRENLEALAAIVRKYDLFLIVDEVYRDFCYDGAAFFSALRLESIEDHVIVIDSVSKRYSACGVRIGAAISRNREVLSSLGRYARLRLSPPVIGQWLTERMIAGEESYLPEVIAEYTRRREVLYQRLSTMPGVRTYMPGGAFYCFARLPVEDAAHFCQWLLEDFEYQGATLMLAEGAAFYATPGSGKDQARLAYILRVEDLHAAMDCLAVALQLYPGRTGVATSLEVSTSGMPLP